MLRLVALLLYLSLTVRAASAANHDELNATADAYLAAYTGQRLDTLASYYTPETVFDDPTSEGFWGARFRVEGGANIVEAIRQGWAGVHGFIFTVRERITFHDRVTLVGTSRLTLDGSMIGRAPGQDYIFDLPAVTILHIRDGKVLLHLDHYDYAPLRPR